MAAFVVGLVLLVWCWVEASPENLVRFSLGNREYPVEGLHNALIADTGVIAGYTLILGACAVVVRELSVSSTGKWLGGVLLPLILLAATSDLIENGLLALTQDRPGDDTLVAVTAGFATVKWAAISAALFGVFAALVVLTQWGVSALTARRKRIDVSADDEHASYKPWWSTAVAAENYPETHWTPSPADAGAVEQQWSWRRAFNVPGTDSHDDKTVRAVCLSGGGVRSACVAMGALQAFADTPDTRRSPGSTAKLLDRLDYVLSVSGGGYTAGARLLAAQPAENSDPWRTGLLSERFNEGSVEYDHLRRHSSYIADSVGSFARALGIVLRNLLASMLLFLWPPVVLGLIAGTALAAVPLAAFTPVQGTQVPANRGAWWAVAVLALLAVGLLLLAILIESITAKRGFETCRLKTLAMSQKCAAAVILVGVLTAVVPALMWACSSVRPAAAAGSVGGVLGLQYVATIVTMIWARRDRVPTELLANPTWRDKLPRGVVQLLIVSVTLLGLFVVWLLVFGSVAASRFGNRSEPTTGAEAVADTDPLLLVGLAVLGGLVALLCLADVTSLSLHPFYRWRLARAFAVRAGGTGGQLRAQPYKDEEATWLHDYGRVDAGPEFVFCAAAAVSGDARPAPGLNAVSYVLGADHIGGPDLGWLKTEPTWQASSTRLKRDLTVQAAVAVSGAAFASAMGRASKGFQTLLAASGARLGTWLPNPAFVAELQSSGSKLQLQALPLVRGFTYYYRELLGLNRASGRLVQVTDGGHYENLALVEALRRRCRLIYCIDGGGDSPPLLEGLADAIRLAYSELGVEIELDQDGDYAVDTVAPGSGGQFRDNEALFSLNRRVTAGTVVLGRIKYPPAAGFSEEATSEGLLVFAKAVLPKKSPEWLLTYAAANPAFPHDSTSDQWFNEGQFAAYTELGRIMGRSAIAAAADYLAPTPTRNPVGIVIDTRAAVARNGQQPGRQTWRWMPRRVR